MRRRALILIALVGLNMATAIAVVQVTHKTRKLFQQLQSARLTHDQLSTEWAQLQLEDSTLASPDRILYIARKKLNMHQPQEFIVLGDKP